MAEIIQMIALSPTMENGQIVRWNKKVGDKVQSGDLLCEVETDKATMDYESLTEGTLLKILLSEGEKASVGEAIAIVGESGENISSMLLESKDISHKSSGDNEPEKKLDVINTTSLSDKDINEPRTLENEIDKIKASPLAKKMILEHRLSLQSISGSGPEGRIIKRDVEKVLKEGVSGQIPLRHKPATLSDETIPITQKRKIIAKRLSESKYTAPHYYLKVTAAMDGILAARKELNHTSKEKVSMNAFLVKFVAEALKKHPMINSTWQGESIVKHGRIDIGLAVAQVDGLITPVVRDCRNKGIIAISEELKILIEKARNNKLMPEEYTGATFTISSLGSFGIEEFTAIINPPGSAILSVGEIRKEPIVKADNTIGVQSSMKMTLSCDHRVIDGVIGAAFLYDLKKMLENPVQALY